MRNSVSKSTANVEEGARGGVLQKELRSDICWQEVKLGQGMLLPSSDTGWCWVKQAWAERERKKLDLEAVVRKVAAESRGSSGVTVSLHVHPKLKQGK